jgi:hypothetical protein
MDTLGFEGVTEAFDWGIVVAIGLAAHRSGGPGGQRRATVMQGMLISLCRASAL